MIRSTLTIWPRSAESSTTSAPIRWAKSFSREPKKPHLVLSTLSPGSTRLRNPASIAEFPEEDRQIVRPCAWRHSAAAPRPGRAGCPRSRGRGGRSSAAASPRTRPGWTLEGPGPHNSRSPGSRAGSEVTRSAMALPFHRAPVGRPAGTKARSIGHGSPRAVARPPERAVRDVAGQPVFCSPAATPRDRRLDEPRGPRIVEEPQLQVRQRVDVGRAEVDARCAGRAGRRARGPPGDREDHPLGSVPFLEDRARVLGLVARERGSARRAPGRPSPARARRVLQEHREERPRSVHPAQAPEPAAARGHRLAAPCRARTTPAGSRAPAPTRTPRDRAERVEILDRRRARHGTRGDRHRRDLPIGVDAR